MAWSVTNTRADRSISAYDTYFARVVKPVFGGSARVELLTNTEYPAKAPRRVLFSGCVLYLTSIHLKPIP